MTMAPFPPVLDGHNDTLTQIRASSTVLAVEHENALQRLAAARAASPDAPAHTDLGDGCAAALEQLIAALNAWEGVDGSPGDSSDASRLDAAPMRAATRSPSIARRSRKWSETPTRDSPSRFGKTATSATPPPTTGPTSTR